MHCLNPVMHDNAKHCASVPSRQKLRLQRLLRLAWLEVVQYTSLVGYHKQVGIPLGWYVLGVPARQQTHNLQVLLGHSAQLAHPSMPDVPGVSFGWHAGDQ
jgi:hypothetical protein